MGRKMKIDKEKLAEDCCFHCKDGGSMRICDYRDCLKAFHPQCVEKDASFLDSEDSWFCKWHFCFICNKTPKFHCFCCPKAVCSKCLCDAEFAVVRSNRGFCNHCLTLAGIVEKVKSDETEIDFNDKTSYEYMFKYYWENVVKEKEHLSQEHICNADKLLNDDSNYECLSVSNYSFEGEDDVSEFEEEICVSNDLRDGKRRKRMTKGKRKKGKTCTRKGEAKSTKIEYNGWGSKLLFDYLISIGEDTTKELSQYEVSDIIVKYCKKNKLFHTEKKKRIVCDEKLKTLFKRPLVNKNSIYKFLTPHFAENFEPSEEDENGYSSEDKDENISMTTKRQRSSSSNKKLQVEEETPDLQQGYFASVNAENIRRLYLKRSMVEELSKQPETFNAKLIGSFVRIKTDPYDYTQKNSHLLLRVTGIKRTSGNGQVNTDILLQASNSPKDIPIDKLSDDNFSKEECEDLRQRIKDGRLEQPTVADFMEKAISLHEVITKHWIVKELAQLRNRIDHANEKGRRRELCEYLARLKLLETQSEQSRLLEEVPKIIADEEVEPADNTCSNTKSKQQTSGNNEISSSSSNGEDFSEQNQRSKGAESEDLMKQHQSVTQENGYESFHKIEGQKYIEEVTENNSRESDPVSNNYIQQAAESEELMQQDQTVPQENGDESQEYSKEMKQNHLSTSDFDDDGRYIYQGQSNVILPETQQQLDDSISKEKKDEDKPVDIENEEVKNKKIAEVIELSDDDVDTNYSNKKGKPQITVDIESRDEDEEEDDIDSPIWNLQSPCGIKREHLRMTLLKVFSDTCPPDVKFKVWKTGQKPEEAVLLVDAIRQLFPQKENKN